MTIIALSNLGSLPKMEIVPSQHGQMFTEKSSFSSNGILLELLQKLPSGEQRYRIHVERAGVGRHPLAGSSHKQYLLDMIFNKDIGLRYCQYLAWIGLRFEYDDGTVFERPYDALWIRREMRGNWLWYCRCLLKKTKCTYVEFYDMAQV